MKAVFDKQRLKQVMYGDVEVGRFYNIEVVPHFRDWVTVQRTERLGEYKIVFAPSGVVITFIPDTSSLENKWTDIGAKIIDQWLAEGYTINVLD